jgi:hypothetical protein
MNKKIDINKKILLGIGVGVAVVIVALVAYLLTPRPVSEGYTAVNTVTNQFFVGRAYRAPLSRFIELREPFLLQTVTAPDGVTVTPQLVDLSVESYWLPQSVFINKDNIVSQGAVGDDSLIATKIREYKAGGAR